MASGESIRHKRLRLRIIEHISKTLKVEEDQIITDGSNDEATSNCPPKLYNSVPDVYYFNREQKVIIIGEAKAYWEDFYNNGFKKQIPDFYNYIKDMIITNPGLVGRIIIAVDNDFHLLAQERIKKKFSSDIKMFEIIT